MKFPEKEKIIMEIRVFRNAQKIASIINVVFWHVFWLTQFSKLGKENSALVSWKTSVTIYFLSSWHSFLLTAWTETNFLAIKLFFYNFFRSIYTTIIARLLLVMKFIANILFEIIMTVKECRSENYDDNCEWFTFLQVFSYVNSSDL